MKITRDEDVPAREVQMEGAHQCRVRWLVGEEDGAPTFAMRQFEVAPGGYTPRHFHNYEHEVYVLEGEGVVVDGDREHPLRPGDVILVQPDDVHQFRNTGDRTLKFLCLVPHTAAGQPITVVAECAAVAPPTGS